MVAQAFCRFSLKGHSNWTIRTKDWISIWQMILRAFVKGYDSKVVQ